MGNAAIYEFASHQTQTSCCSCGVLFCVPKGFLDAKLQDGTDFFCPNGHSLTYRPSIKREVERLRAEVADRDRWLKSRAEFADRMREQRDAAQRRASAAQRRASAAHGQVTKLKNRVGNGVCPCCNRTFQNLLRHMHTQHPGFASEESHATPASSPAGPETGAG